MSPRQPAHGPGHATASAPAEAEVRATVDVRATAEAPAPRPGRPSPSRLGRHLPVGLYGLLVVGVFAGVISTSAAVGAWQTSGRTAVGGAAVTLDGASTTEIKGWMTVGDVAAAFGIPLPAILDTFALDPNTPPSTAIKDLESDVFSVTALRDWLDLQRAVAP